MLDPPRPQVQPQRGDRTGASGDLHQLQALGPLHAPGLPSSHHMHPLATPLWLRDHTARTCRCRWWQVDVEILDEQEIGRLRSVLLSTRAARQHTTNSAQAPATSCVRRYACRSCAGTMAQGIACPPTSMRLLLGVGTWLHCKRWTLTCPRLQELSHIWEFWHWQVCPRLVSRGTDQPLPDVAPLGACESTAPQQTEESWCVAATTERQARPARTPLKVQSALVFAVQRTPARTCIWVPPGAKWLTAPCVCYAPSVGGSAGCDALPSWFQRFGDNAFQFHLLLHSPVFRQ